MLSTCSTFNCCEVNFSRFGKRLFAKMASTRCYRNKFASVSSLNLVNQLFFFFKHVFNEVCFLAYVYQFICEHVRVWKGQDVLKVPCLEIKSSRLFPGNLDQNWRVIFTYHPRAKNNQLKKATNLVLDNTLCAYFCLHFDSFHYFNWLIVQRTLPKHGRNASFTCSSQSIISPYVLIL